MNSKHFFIGLLTSVITLSCNYENKVSNKISKIKVIKKEWIKNNTEKDSSLSSITLFYNNDCLDIYSFVTKNRPEISEYKRFFHNVMYEKVVFLHGEPEFKVKKVLNANYYPVNIEEFIYSTKEKVNVKVSYKYIGDRMSTQEFSSPYKGVLKVNFSYIEDYLESKITVKSGNIKCKSVYKKNGEILFSSEKDDTTFYYYDSEGKLSSKENKIKRYEYVYDNSERLDSIIEFQKLLEVEPRIVNFRKYSYYNNDSIKSISYSAMQATYYYTYIYLN